MVYRLLVVNIDGTLLQSNGRLNKLTKEAIEYVHRKGVHTALVTSRSYHSARKAAKALKINPMLVAAQGSFIGSDLDKPIFVQHLAEELTQEMVQLLEKTVCQIQLVHEKQMLANRLDIPENLLGKAVLYMNEQNFYSQHYVDVLSDELSAQPFSAGKIDVCFQNEGDRNEMAGLIREMFPEVSVIEKDRERLTIVPRGVSKWHGILLLAEYLGVRHDEIVAIGDSEDDLEMIASCGLGVAMGNAPLQVKQAAKWVTRSNDENGVAYMLKEFFRKQHPIGFLEKMNTNKS